MFVDGLHTPATSFMSTGKSPVEPDQILLIKELLQRYTPAVQKMDRRNRERTEIGIGRLYALHKGHTTKVTASKASQSRLKSLVRRFLSSQIHLNYGEGMDVRMAKDSGNGVREIITPTSQLISNLIPRHTDMRQYLLDAHLLSLTKRNQFGNNIQTSTVHNVWPVLEILDEAPIICQDRNTVFIRVERTIERSTHSNKFRSRDGTVVIPLILNLTSLTGALLNIPLPSLPVFEWLPSV
ncbi:hypothetical protein TNCV_1494821 [Trichonephila clavipes]|nr:hypothetical protein TNCV_1494821 [Trichonephila clavipes]